ncbi:MAG: tRNA pseudouridine(55) synthase TruB [Acidobacteriota bacterium]
MGRRRAERPGAPSGVLVLDKPSGPTSHDLVSRVRRALDVRRVGHGGTLDPMATGVLACFVGKATRLVRYLGGADKTYLGTARLGWATDTGDAEGVARAEPVIVPELTDEQVETAMAGLTGDLLQRPPMVSAKKKDGKKLYELAREGVEIEREPVPVSVRHFALLERDAESIRFEVCCSAGTYVRVLAEELGEALGVPAHLAALRRTAAGPFTLEQAVSGDELTRESAEGALLSLTDVPLGMPELCVDAGGRRAFLHGQAVTGETITKEGDTMVVKDGEGALLGVGRVTEGGEVQPETVVASVDED